MPAAATPPVADAASAERRERLDRELELADLVAQRSTVDAASEKTRMALEELGDHVIGAVPPSYRCLLAQCLDDGDEASRVRCIFRRLLEANGIDPSQGRYADCESPPGPVLPRLSRDRQAAHFPLSREGSLTSGYQRVDVGSLLAEPGGSTGSPWLNPREAGFAEAGLLGAHDLHLARVDVDGVQLGVLLRDLHARGGIPLSDPPSGTWETVRMPLLTTLVVLIAALGASEPELGATGLLIPTLAAALPAVLRVLSAIGRAAARDQRGLTRLSPARQFPGASRLSAQDRIRPGMIGNSRLIASIP